MFKKDEYIVCLNTPISDNYFPRNFIFKQSQNLEYLSVYLDIEDQENGWSLISFNKDKQFSEWRYATFEEIQHYESIGKPYNVEEIVHKIQTYDYLIPILTKLNIT